MIVNSKCLLMLYLAALLLIVGCAGNGKFAPECSKEFESGAIDFFEVEVKPELTNNVVPVYPESTRKEGIEGQVLVKVIIGTDGKVECASIDGVKPESAAGYFENSALEAAAHMIFTPGKQDGKTVRVRRYIPIKFSL